MWRRGPDALCVDVEEDGRARTDTWPAIGPSAVNEIELLVRYEEELCSRGYAPDEWGEARLSLRSNNATGKSYAK